jgi:hypothetical protein
MRYRSFAQRVVFIAGLGCALAGVGMAQNRSTAEVSGNVKDPTGAAVPQVKVTVVNTETRVPVTVQTNEAGYYDVPLLQPGPYTLTFEKAGFSTARRADVSLELDQTARVDIKLGLGETRQVVEVQDVNPLLERDNSEEETVF